MKSNLLYTTLIQIGITPATGELYTALIQFKKPTVSFLATELGKSRRQVYAGLKELKGLGLVEDQADFQRGVIPVSPSYVTVLIKQKEAGLISSTTGLAKIIPEFMANFDRLNQNPNIQTY